MLKNSFRRSPQPTIYTPSFELLWFMHLQLVPIVQKSLHLINWSTRSPHLNLNLSGTIFTTQPSEGQPCQFLIPRKNTMLRSSKMAREAEPAQIKAAPTKLKGPTCRKKNRFDMATCAVALQRLDVPSRKLTWRKSPCSIVDTSSNGCVFACSFPGVYFDWKRMQRSNKWKEPKHVFLARKNKKKQWIETGGFL